jgi:hypothetical protein
VEQTDQSLASNVDAPEGEKAPLLLRIPARILSTVFHPFIIPLYCCLILFHFHHFRYVGVPYKQKVITLIIVFCCTFLYPALAIIIMNKLKLVDSVNLRNRKDRILPYIAGLTFNIWLAYMAIRPGNHPVVPYDKLFMHMVLGGTISLILSFLGNIVLKTSLHMLGMGGLVGFLMFTAQYAEVNTQWLFIGALLMAGAVGSSRIVLKAHEPAEVYTGFFLGWLSQFLSYQVFFYFSILN